MTVTPDPSDELAGLLSPPPLVSPGHYANKLARSLHSGRIAGLLREAIIGGELPAGTPLVEMRLAERLGVSRGPIRSALHVLQGEGLVQTLPNGRTISAGLDASDLHDLFGVRFELEALGIRQGVERGAALDPVRKAMEAIESEGASTARLVDLDVDFHRSLVAFSGSRFLVQSWLAIAPVIQAVITIGNRRLAEKDPASNFARIAASHRDLFHAISAKAVDEATALLAEQFSLTQSMFTIAKEDAE
jgi:DNA-binding GntR family transcriptional regulator